MSSFYMLAFFDLFFSIFFLFFLSSGPSFSMESCRPHASYQPGKKIFVACFANESELQGLSVLANKAKVLGEAVSSSYASAGFSHWVSLHFNGSVRQKISHKSQLHGWNRNLDHQFIQLGHPLFDPIYFSYGRIAMPFGLNHDIFRLAMPSRGNGLWLFSVPGARASVNWRGENLFEVGVYRTDDVSGKDSGPQTISSRFVRNLDLLDGTKIIASYICANDYSEHRMSFAAMFHNEGSKSSFEFVRKSQSSFRPDLSQIFRLAHEQEEESWSWNFSGEELLRNSFRLSFGLRKPWNSKLSNLVSIHVLKDYLLPNSDMQLSFLLGLNYSQAFSYERKGL